ncbi:MAG: TIGR00725 family protein [Candidatus Auribacterota bacterium]|nr:TIGR00725 family protein [Candidatus Auribacterota bacterium]
MKIGVIGSSDCNAEEGRLARKVGRLISEQGHILVCGGLGGVMEEASRGAFEEGGITVGVLPGESADSANEYVKIAVPTGMGVMRNALVVRFSDVLIAIGGWYGTLSEIALALNMGKTVVGLRTWKCSINDKKAEITRADSPEDAVEKALKAAGSSS